MKVVGISVEDLGEDRFRLMVDLEAEAPRIARKSESPIGGGPAQTGTVPDRIVNALIQAVDHSLTLSELHQIVGGNPGTVSRQAWTLATNARDLQIRLRGWVYSPERGRYALTPEAVRAIQGVND